MEHTKKRIATNRSEFGHENKTTENCEDKNGCLDTATQTKNSPQELLLRNHYILQNILEGHKFN